jgi:argininosuccinate lyase
MLPMPGYTHLQRAVPSSMGALLAGHAEAFLDDVMIVRGAAAALDSSPLGTAAGYGVNLPLDREGVARELGFSRVRCRRCTRRTAAASSSCWRCQGCIRRCSTCAAWRGT